MISQVQSPTPPHQEVPFLSQALEVFIIIRKTVSFLVVTSHDHHPIRSSLGALGNQFYLTLHIKNILKPHRTPAHYLCKNQDASFLTRPL